MRIRLPITEAIPASTNGCGKPVVQGSNFGFYALEFDHTTEQTCYFGGLLADGYDGNGLTFEYEWEADSMTSGDLKMEVSLAAITPNTDSQDLETKAFATAQSGTDSHLGTTAKRLHRATITISNLDGLAAGDYFALKLARKAGDAADTLNTAKVRIVGASVYDATD